MDRYVRQNKVWTPEQMFSDFFEMINEELDRKTFTIEFCGHETIWSGENAIKWLNTEKGRKFALERFQKKYLKDKPIADRKSPLVERVRFGFIWDRKSYFDINFGLKNGYNFIKTDELEKLTTIPWTINHVNKELNEKCNTDLLQCLGRLSTSHLEKTFVEQWEKKFYKDENPALIPEVCGLRCRFFYNELGDNVSTKYISREAKPVNFRYDFLIANFNKQKITFIELDGFEFHKTRKQQSIDSIKRNKAAYHNISLLSFTSKRILEDIDNVFNELTDYLT